MIGDSALWTLNRATGVVSFVLLTLVTVLGIAVTRQGRLPGLPRFVTAGLHRSTALLTVAFLAVHVATAVIDPYVPLRWADAVVPFVSAYEPVGLGLGALAVDLLLAVVLTSLVRVRLGRRGWKAVHWLAYGSWPLALAHGLAIGTDTASPVVLVTGVLCCLAVAAALAWRLLAPAPAPAERVAALLAHQEARR